MCTENPAKAVGWTNASHLHTGKQADLSILDIQDGTGWSTMYWGTRASRTRAVTPVMAVKKGEVFEAAGAKALGLGARHRLGRINRGCPYG